MGFQCRAEKNEYCNKWLRSCVGWSECNLKSYGAPCPGCVYSSPLESSSCQSCEHVDWKRELLYKLS